MEEVAERLKKGAEDCLKNYEAWRGNEKNREARESLQEAVHELRKIASRIEIDIAMSERDQATQKPIPIPPHRDARRRNNDDDIGNVLEGHDGGSGPSQGRSSGGGRRRSGGGGGGSRRKSSGGGGNDGNQ